MKKINHLTRFDSQWNIVETYSFISREYFATKEGIVFLNENKISNGKPHKNLTVEVRLIDDLGLTRRFKLHQIILQTFKPEGIKNGFSVDHINRKDRINNSLSNLRWADRDIQYKNRENVLHLQKKVKCENNGIIYQSCQHAEKSLNLVKNTVARVARGDRKSIHGYTFIYV